MSPPGPAKQFDRNDALHSGLHLFWKRGYADVSLNDLLAEMKIGRQSFYNTFGSKAELFDEAVTSYIERCQRPMIEILFSESSPHRSIVKMLAQWESSAAAAPNDGCFLVNTCDDFPSLRAESVELVAGAIKHWEASIARRVDEAKKAGEIESDLSARKIAQILTMLGNGMMIAARGSGPKGSTKGLLTETFRRIAPPTNDPSAS